MKYFLTAALIFMPLLQACSAGNYEYYLRMYDIPEPSTDSFTHCYNYGCQTRALVSLPEATTKKLKKLFTPPSENAEEEQQRISEAIKIFENDIGEITGTKNDKRGTFRLYQDNAETTKQFQQDCVDESTNTTIYLALLYQMEFITFHKPVYAASRQPFLGGAPWWHQTAVMTDIEKNQKYAVDSWFRDNGHSAFVVPLKEWKNGWMPPKIKNAEQK